jgi:hypothetical protein
MPRPTRCAEEEEVHDRGDGDVDRDRRGTRSGAERPRYPRLRGEGDGGQGYGDEDVAEGREIAEEHDRSVEERRTVFVAFDAKYCPMTANQPSAAPRKA